VGRVRAVRSPSMHAVEVVIFALWALFWLGWLAASIGNKPGRSGLTRGVGARVVISVVIIVLFRAHAFRGRALISDPWLLGIGFALFVAGLGLAVWARVNIGRNWGTPMSQKSDPVLVKVGPYRVIRHPIYSGIILASLGTAMAVSPYWLIPTALFGTYFVYSAFMEERYMSERFPEAYAEYKRSTKMLIPFVF